MQLVSLLSWWYGLGWARLLQKVMGRVHDVLAFFSVVQLLGSLFAPFRQISVARSRGTVQDQLAAWGDRLFSRAIGAVIRLLLIAAGLGSALVMMAIGAVLILTWPILPVLPIVGIFLTQMAVNL